MDRLAATPGDLDAIQAIETAYSSEGRWEQLLRLCMRTLLRINQSSLTYRCF